VTLTADFAQFLIVFFFVVFTATFALFLSEFARQIVYGFISLIPWIRR